jgi:hypothetical protein
MNGSVECENMAAMDLAEPVARSEALEHVRPPSLCAWSAPRTWNRREGGDNVGTRSSKGCPDSYKGDKGVRPMDRLEFPATGAGSASRPEYHRATHAERSV